jgi:hypothetical protein
VADSGESRSELNPQLVETARSRTRASAADWDRATINGDQATIAYQEHRWLIRRAVLSADPSRGPWRLEGAWDWHLTLLRQDGHWRVDALDGQCVSGCP